MSIAIGIIALRLSQDSLGALPPCERNVPPLGVCFPFSSTCETDFSAAAGGCGSIVELSMVCVKKEQQHKANLDFQVSTELRSGPII